MSLRQRAYRFADGASALAGLGAPLDHPGTVQPAAGPDCGGLPAQRAAGSMREPGSGRILLISRAAALTGGIADPHHAAPRAGVNLALLLVGVRRRALSGRCHAGPGPAATASRWLSREPTENA